MFVSAAIALTVPRRPAVLMMILVTIIRMITSIGLEPTLILLGSLNVRAASTKRNLSILYLGINYH